MRVDRPTASHPAALRWLEAVEQELEARQERDAAIVAEVTKGRTLLDVAYDFGMNPSHVGEIAREVGVWRRKGRARDE